MSRPERWRAIWHENETWYPSCEDFDTEAEANAFAMSTSDRINGPVEVRHFPNGLPT